MTSTTEPGSPTSCPRCRARTARRRTLRLVATLVAAEWAAAAAWRGLLRDGGSR